MANAQPPLGLLQPPVSDQDPPSVNPFVNPLLVTLSVPGTDPSLVAIYFDTNSNSNKFKIAQAQKYDPANGPIVISATTTLRAMADYGDLGTSDVSTWQYNLDAAPVVNFLTPSAGQIYHTGGTVSMTASVTDNDGPDPVTVKYYLVGSGGLTFLGDGAGPTYKFDRIIPDGTASGTNTIRAIAMDGRGLTGSDNVTLSIAANQPPVAHAGADTAIVLPNNTVALDGSASSDPDDPAGTTLKYQWSGPAGVSFTGANTVNPTATFSGQGVYNISLKVTDQGSPPLSSINQISVSVNAKPAITSADSKSGLTNAAFTYALTASGFPLPALSATGLNGAPLPGWLSFSGGALSGTPTLAGTYSVALSAGNSVGTDSKTLTITISDALTIPVLTSAQTTTGAVATVFSFQATATGNPAPTFTATGLPAGLSISTAGLISGTPTTGGSTVVSVKATNSQGSDTKPLTININQPPAITSASSKSGLTNAAFTYTMTASGFPQPTLSATGLNGGPLPGWLSFSGGILSGTPTLAGTYSVALSAANTVGTDPKTLTITIKDPVATPVITSGQPPSGAVTVPFNFQVTATGNPAPTFTATGLPPGLSINVTGPGQISGTPTAGGSTVVSVKATNSQGSDSASLNIIINQPPGIKTSGTIPSGNVGTALTAPFYTVTTTGYPAPALAASGLPGGLVLNTNGTITGTPTVAGSFPVTFTATSVSGTATKPVTINIGAALTAPNIKSLSSQQGITGQPFSASLTVTGNPAPVVSAGGPNGSALPAWLTFNSGVLSSPPGGNPPTAGQFPILFTAKNTQGTDTATFVLTIVLAPAPPNIATLTPASGTVNIPFQYSVSANGNPAPVFSASAGPAWLTLTPGPGGTGSLTGKPPAKGNYSIKLTATNTQGSDTATLSISISDSTVKPAITSAVSKTGKTGTAFAYSITSTGTSPIAFATTALPAGLSLSGSVITGSPTASGTFSVTLTATNAYGKDTKVLAITINADPRINLDLDTGITVFDKSKVTFKVSASGFPAVTYQWQYNPKATGIYTNTGPNAATYTIDPVSSSSAGYYRVIVKNGVGPDVTSKVRHLIIKPLPLPIRISTQPVGGKAVVGEMVTFISSATGEPKLMYQWYKGNIAVTTAPKPDDSIFTIAAAALADSGFYRLRVTNSYTVDNDPSTFAFSDSAKLVVELPKLTKPVATPAGGPFFPDTKVTLNPNPSGADIYYTLTGATPTRTSTQLYNPGDVIPITATTVLKARAFKTGYQASDVTTETYTLTVKDKVIKPVINPTTANFQNTLTFSLSSATDSARIYFTTDGSNPLTGSPRLFNKTPITITGTTTVIAVAKVTGMIDSDTLQMTYILEKNPSKVLAPKISPAGGTFSGQAYVILSSPADTAAAIYYTLDGSSPDTSSTHSLYQGKPISISKTTTLKVVATRTNFINSDIVSETYKLIPGPISAKPAPGVFDSVTTVTLSALPANAEIHYIVDGTPTSDSPVFPVDGLALRGTGTISAIAILDSVSSAVYSFGYTLKGTQLATPAITTSTGQTTFKDSLRVWLTPPTPDALLYYTKDGTQPTVKSDKYSGPIPMDTTTTLEVIAVQKGFENSRLLVSTFTLVPDMPTVSPPGGISTSTIYAKLSCSSKRASLFYTLDGSDPTPDSRTPYAPGDSIPIQVSSVLKAVAVAGNEASPVREETYSITGDIVRTLMPGVTSPLPGGYSVRVPEDQTSKVELRTIHTAPLHLVGFDGVQYAFILALDSTEAFTGAEFPTVTFTSSNSDKRSMYKIDPSGKIYFVSSADTVTLIQAGVYFMGIDIAPPVITYLNETFEGDSTRVNFHITDNIANLSYDLKRNDDPARNVSGVFISSGVDLSVKLKHPTGTLKPLYVQVVVSDYQQAAFFPPDPTAMLSLSQRLGPLRGPPAWGIGTKGSPYDLISVPLALNPPLTLKDLQSANPGAGIEGAGWDYNSDTTYLRLDASTALLPGKGYWIGSHLPVTSLSLPSANTSGRGSVAFTVDLHHGWNQIGNPHLEELYWPSSRNLGDAYKTFAVKGLWEYSPAIVNYVESESMKPWRGYYVYNYLQDTTITLFQHPVTVLAMKKTGAESGISLSMGWGAARTLHLGADWTSADDLGIEDEFSLPQRNSGLFMHALRGGHSLTSDWIRMKPSGIQQWKVALGGTGDSLPPLKVLAQDLPAEFETWAVSPARGMKFKVDAGAEIPASGLAQDTLIIYSGSKENLAKFGPLKIMAVAAASLDMRVSARNGGFAMQMSLPSKARFRAVLWGIDGTRKGELAMGPLSQGFYRFSWDTDFRKRNARLAPGMYFLSLEVQGAGINTRLTRKIALSN